ncbi:MAG TPA: DUF445 family protein [Acidimicrobiales bacterium]|nr:DUF445 family protein [Acidimicrobiales bacterium]
MGETAITFLIVPVVTAFIGYVTNWTAVKMIFHPREPVGIGPLKWQGIVYRLAPKFASEIAATTGKVLSPDDVVDRVAPAALATRVVAEHPGEVDAIIGEAFDALASGAWESMAPPARDQLRSALLAQVDESAGAAVAELGHRAGELVDLDRIIVDQLSGDNADRLARVAGEVGARELRFIELYGGVFGFVVGLVQAAGYSMFGRWWTMPIVGAVVGLGTNWLAIQMIFRPLEPRRYLGLITYQGMFPKRQREIAVDYGRIVATEVLTPRNLIDHISASPALADVGRDLTERARVQIASMRPLLTMLTGTEPSDAQLDKAVGVLTERLGHLLGVARASVEDHLAASLRLDALVEDRLGALDKLQFERMLRGIFEEDEVILVVIGGALGGAVGVVQGGMIVALGL